MSNYETAFRVKKRHYMRIFKKAHALNPEKAILPAEYGISMGKVFRKLVRDRILVNAGGDKFYLDEIRDYKLRRRASIIVIVILLVIVLTTFIGFAISALNDKVF
jgi:hypothetical protein